jgi:hypothetical protein
MLRCVQGSLVTLSAANVLSMTMFLSMTGRPDCHGGHQDASHRSNYDTLTATSSTKKADVAELDDVVALKASVTVCPA